MRKFFLLMFFALTLVNVTSAQNQRVGNDRFSLKVQPFVGGYLSPNGNLEVINPSAPAGVNFGFEFPSSQQRPWQQYLNNSTLGVGVSYIDLGDKVMGKAVSVYPYIMINCLRTKYVELGIKLASGLAYCSETYWTNELEGENPDYTGKPDVSNRDNPKAHYTFGSHLNAYLCGGVNLTFPLTRNLALNGEVGFFHMSNGRMMEPNMGANILYGGVGLVATINPEEEKEPIKFPDLPYRWSLNVALSAGTHSADLTDGHNFLINTFHVGAVYNVCNWYGIGLGADVFYNGAIDANTNRGLFRDDIEYKNSDKVRAGVSINNELQFGRVTAMIDWGVYLYNPARNYYNDDGSPYYKVGEKRPLFYKMHRAGADEAWHYIRFGVKYRVWDNIYVQALAKTHMHIAELIEFGVGYNIPFISKSKRKNNKDVIFHNREGWWNNY
ncbi:MAG: acyloxyacyl hydrolase [Bacteroidaceae bacterium]|nr:acyloxyacyl hydrolase [Bacteroidaceae bacterium]